MKREVFSENVDVDRMTLSIAEQVLAPGGGSHQAGGVLAKADADRCVENSARTRVGQRGGDSKSLRLQRQRGLDLELSRACLCGCCGERNYGHRRQHHPKTCLLGHDAPHHFDTDVTFYRFALASATGVSSS